MCKKHKVRILLEQFWRLQQITAKARKHTWYFYQVVRKTSLQSVQETQSSHPFGTILALATNHGKSSQTHLVFLPSSSKDLTRKVCKKHKVRILLEQFWRLQQITAKARKHTWYFYQVVRKTSLQSVQETQSSHPFGTILALATNHGKSSQTHLVFLPSSSKDLTAKCARNTKFASFWNNFGACNKSRQKLANTPGISTK